MRTPQPPPSLPDLLRSHASDLGSALAQAPYQEAVRTAESRYRHWDKLKYIARAENLDPELLWTIVKTARRAQYRTLPLRGHQDEPLKFTLPDILQEELMHIDQQLAGQLVAQDERPLNEAQKERFIISSLREEAIASSMLEGAATTHREAKDMLASGRKPRTHGERMVVNNYEAISFIREHRQTSLTPEFILELQRIITSETIPAEQSGRFRGDADNVRIVDSYGEVLHTPPPASDLKTRLDELCRFANQKSTPGLFIHPVVRACIIHFQIGFDHPFCDGNGRTARALFYWSMLRAGYWLFEYLPISRMIYAGPVKYSEAYLYTETDEFDVTYFLVYNARIFTRARQELRDYLAAKRQEMVAARELFETDDRLNHRQRDIIARLVRDPSLRLTIQEHQGRQNVAYETARSDLLDLAEWGYLARTPSRRKQFQFQRGPKLTNHTTP